MSDEIVINIVNYVIQKPTDSLVEFIKSVKEHTNDPDIVCKVIEKIAAGNDGIAGTSDDVFSPEMLDMIKILLKNEAMKELIDEIKIPPGCCLSI
jgi:hypothetical protein